MVKDATELSPEDLTALIRADFAEFRREIKRALVAQAIFIVAVTVGLIKLLP